MNKLVPKESGGEFLLYQTEDGQVMGWGTGIIK